MDMSNFNNNNNINNKPKFFNTTNTSGRRLAQCRCRQRRRRGSLWTGLSEPLAYHHHHQSSPTGSSSLSIPAAEYYEALVPTAVAAAAACCSLPVSSITGIRPRQTGPLSAPYDFNTFPTSKAGRRRPWPTSAPCVKMCPTSPGRCGVPGWWSSTDEAGP